MHYFTELKKYKDSIRLGGISIDVKKTNEKLLEEICEKSIENSRQIMAYCEEYEEGSRFVNAYMKALEKNKGNYKIRPIMSLKGLMDEELLDKCNILDIQLGFADTQIYYKGDEYYNCLKLYNEENKGITKLCPINSARIRGINFAFHQEIKAYETDMPLSIYNSVNRQSKTGRTIDENEKISIPDALCALTLNQAGQIFEEKYKGSITEGKMADFVILNKSPFEIRKEEIKNLKIISTIKAGKTVYQAG